MSKVLSSTTLEAMLHTYWSLLHSSEGTQSEAEQWVYRVVYYTVDDAISALRECDKDPFFNGYRIGRYAQIYNHAIECIDSLRRLNTFGAAYTTLYELALAQLEKAKELDVFGTTDTSK